MESQTTTEPQKTLKEKLKEHYESKTFMLTPESANRWGVIFTVCFIPSLWIALVWIVIPQSYRNDPELEWKLRFIAHFLGAQCFVNWLLAVRMGKSILTEDKILNLGRASLNLGLGNTSNGTTQPQNGWKLCPSCQLNTPPRSHHCKICEVCVLKRDHHCFFTGTCVGFSNHRRFIVSVFYFAIGSMFSTYHIGGYMNELVPIMNFPNFFSWLPPIASTQWLFGYIPLSHFLLIFIAVLSFIIQFAAAGFFLWQVILTFRGQTTYELERNINVYRQSWMTNIYNVFGPFGFIHFLIPLPKDLPGDGMNWKVTEHAKGH